MAGKKVVTERSLTQLQDVLQEISEERGQLRLALLSSTELAERWSLLVSAPWMDDSGPRSVITDITSRLVGRVDKSLLSAIDHVTVIPGSDPFVTAFAKTVRGFLGVDPSTHRGGFQVHSIRIEGRDIGQGFVFAANPRTENLAGHKLAAR